MGWSALSSPERRLGAPTLLSLPARASQPRARSPRAASLRARTPRTRRRAPQRRGPQRDDRAALARARHKGATALCDAREEGRARGGVQPHSAVRRFGQRPACRVFSKEPLCVVLRPARPSLLHSQLLKLCMPLPSDSAPARVGLVDSNVLPNPGTRVMLTAKDNDPTSTFINANFVSSLSGKRYIATQGPMPSTIPDFWYAVRCALSHFVVGGSFCTCNCLCACPSLVPRTPPTHTPFFPSSG